jgi:hypothetical protein
MDTAVKDLLSSSHGLVGVFSSAGREIKSDFETFHQTATEFDGPVVVLTDSDPLLQADIDYPLHEVPLESLRKEYIKGDGDSNMAVVEPILEME